MDRHALPFEARQRRRRAVRDDGNSRARGEQGLGLPGSDGDASDHHGRLPCDVERDRIGEAGHSPTPPPPTLIERSVASWRSNVSRTSTSPAAIESAYDPGAVGITRTASMVRPRSDVSA